VNENSPKSSPILTDCYSFREQLSPPATVMYPLASSHQFGRMRSHCV